MKRSATEVLRRGFDNMLANWPLLVIQIAETIVFIALIAVTVVAVVLPIAVSAGLRNLKPAEVPDPWEAVATIMLEHWLLILYIAAAVTLLLLVLMLVHSFVVGGCARVYVDGEGKVASTYSRNHFHAFSMERWAAGGKQLWWAIFWIYNLVWGVAAVVLMLPLLPVAAGLIVFRESPAAIVFGCLAIVGVVGVSIPVAFMANLIARKAIVDAAVIGGTPHVTVAVRQAWINIRSDLARHLGIAVLITLIGFGGSAAISLFSAPLSIGDSTPLALFTLPIRMVAMVFSGALSAAMAGWFLAALAAMSTERPT